mmetsp:Transcript_17095/g.39885  ORF Transcript_17095/g.39885 Transcript_17095/m.39885 type:complete len:92 (-) Transcript_17095:22-297(-)
MCWVSGSMLACWGMCLGADPCQSFSEGWMPKLCLILTSASKVWPLHLQSFILSAASQMCIVTHDIDTVSLTSLTKGHGRLSVAYISSAVGS